MTFDEAVLALKSAHADFESSVARQALDPALPLASVRASIAEARDSLARVERLATTDEQRERVTPLKSYAASWADQEESLDMLDAISARMRSETN